MPVVPRSLRSLLMLGAALMLPLSSQAQTGRRHVVLPVVGKATLTGVVRDAASGLPIKSVALTASDGQHFFTGDDGRYLFNVVSRPLTIQVERVGFLPASKTLVAGAPLTLDFALSYAPAVVVTTVGGETVTLDLASSKFAYSQVFSGFINADTANLCKEGGAAFAPNKSDFSRIVGPAVSVTSAPCCDRGPVLKANAEMKNGEKVAVYFVDSCFGYEPYFLGLERTSAAARYLKFTDIARIDFP
jgi:hypothetical protein